MAIIWLLLPFLLKARLGLLVPGSWAAPPLLILMFTVLTKCLAEEAATCATLLSECKATPNNYASSTGPSATAAMSLPLSLSLSSAEAADDDERWPDIWSARESSSDSSLHDIHKMK